MAFNHLSEEFLHPLINKMSPESSWEMMQIAGHKGPCSKVEQWRKQLREIDQVIGSAILKQQTDWNVSIWLGAVQRSANDVDSLLGVFASQASQCKLVAALASQCNITGKKRASSKKVECCCFSDLDANVSDDIINITDRLEGLNRERDELGLRAHSGNRRNRTRTLCR